MLDWLGSKELKPKGGIMIRTNVETTADVRRLMDISLITGIIIGFMACLAVLIPITAVFVQGVILR